MNYLYHKVPKEMRGNILYPLNQLKKVDEDLYNQQNTKYKGRESDTNIHIEKLHCGWGDVIHLSAVDPREIYAELRSLGKDYNPKFYKINPSKLDPLNTVVLIPPRRKVWSAEFRDEDFVPFDSVNLEKYAVFPEETKKYYKEAIDSNRLPLVYNRIPHILYKGNIDMSDVEIIEVKEELQ